MEEERKMAVATEPIKLIYYAPVPEGRTIDAFRKRWNQHAELAMSLPLWRHMVRNQQFDCVEKDQLPAALPEATGVGGFGAIWVRDMEALSSIADDGDIPKVRADEVETFGREVGGDVVPCIPHQFIEQEPGKLTLIGKVWRQQDVSPEDFESSWLSHGNELVNDPDSARLVTYYTQNHALPGTDGADGFFQIGFSSAADLATFCEGSAVSGDIAAKTASYLQPGGVDALVCQERRLYDTEEVQAPA
jgi:hypothetical protein